MKNKDCIAELCAMYLKNFCAEEKGCSDCPFFCTVDNKHICKIGDAKPEKWDAHIDE